MTFVDANGGEMGSPPKSSFPFLDSVHDVTLRGELNYHGEKSGTVSPRVRVLYEVNLLGCPCYRKGTPLEDLKKMAAIRKFQGFLMYNDVSYGLNSRALVDFVSAEERATSQSRPRPTHADIFQSEKTLDAFLKDKSGYLAGTTYAFVDGVYQASFSWADANHNQLSERVIMELLSPFESMDEKRYGLKAPLNSAWKEDVDTVRKTLAPSLTELLSSVVGRFNLFESEFLRFSVEDVYKNTL